MNIALIHTRLKRVGGLETRLFSYIDAFASRGHRVYVVVSKVESVEKLPENVAVVSVPMGHIPKPLRIRYQDRVFQRAIRKLPIDFSLTLTRIAGADAALVPANHPGYLEAIARHPTLHDRWTIAAEKNAWQSAGMLLACSNMMKEQVTQFYDISPEKVRVLYPPTDTDRFRPGLKSRKEEFRQKHGIPKDKFVCVLVSTSHRRKGLPLLLETFAQLSGEPFELVVAGSAPKTRLPANARYLGYIKATEELFAAADAMVLPALFEPFGQVVSEAILCGTPVILSKSVGAGEIVSGEEGVIVSENTPVAWAEAIRSVAARKFHITSDFALRHGLDIDRHIAQILDVAVACQK